MLKPAFVSEAISGKLDVDVQNRKTDLKLYMPWLSQLYRKPLPAQEPEALPTTP